MRSENAKLYSQKKVEFDRLHNHNKIDIPRIGKECFHSASKNLFCSGQCFFSTRQKTLKRRTFLELRENQ